MPHPRTRPRISCPICGTETIHPRACSQPCHVKLLRREKMTRWVAGDSALATAKGGGIAAWARNALLEAAGGECPRCKWSEVHPVSGRCPLQTNHIDGDAMNNAYENLEVLCPNCHALTETWGGHNKNDVRMRLGLPLLSHRRSAARHHAALKA